MLFQLGRADKEIIAQIVRNDNRSGKLVSKGNRKGGENMAYGDIQLKLVGGNTILEKLNELDKLSKQMRNVIYDLDHLGFIHIDKSTNKGVDVNAEKE